MKLINFFILSLLLLVSCGSFKEAGKVLRNEKVQSTDEFLVKKRNPLILPPNYEKLPKPGSKLEKKDNEDEKIKKILKAPKSDEFSKTKSSSVEESILNRIRK